MLILGGHGILDSSMWKHSVLVYLTTPTLKLICSSLNQFLTIEHLLRISKGQDYQVIRASTTRLVLFHKIFNHTQGAHPRKLPQ